VGIGSLQRRGLLVSIWAATAGGTRAITDKVNTQTMSRGELHDSR